MKIGVETVEKKKKMVMGGGGGGVGEESVVEEEDEEDWDIYTYSFGDQFRMYTRGQWVSDKDVRGMAVLSCIIPFFFSLQPLMLKQT